jgi:hypothetical protein
MADYEELLDDYEEDAPTVAFLPGEVEPEEVFVSDAGLIAMTPIPPNPLIGKTVRVWDKARYDYGLTGTITETKPGDYLVRVWLDNGAAAWYAPEDLEMVDNPGHAPGTPGGSPPTSGAVAG